MLGQQLHEPEGQGRRKGPQRGRDVEPGGEGRVRVSDRGLHGPAEALLIHGRVELTGERTAPPLMMVAEEGVGGDVGAGLRGEVSLMGWWRGEVKGGEADTELWSDGLNRYSLLCVKLLFILMFRIKDQLEASALLCLQCSCC